MNKIEDVFRSKPGVCCDQWCFALVFVVWVRLVWLLVWLVSRLDWKWAMSCILSKSSSGEVSSQPPL